MILFSHKSKYFIWVGFLYFIFPLLCISFFADTQDLWFKNIFSDKTFVMLIMPAFVLGAVIIDSSISPVIMVRTKNKLHSFTLLRDQQYWFAIIHTIIWMLSIIFITQIIFGKIYAISFWGLIREFARCICGFIIFINISLIIKVKCKKKYMAASYIVVYIFFTAEIFSIVPLLNKFFPINIYLIFSWLFRDTIISYLVIAGWISVTYYLGRKSSKNMDVL